MVHMRPIQSKSAVLWILAATIYLLAEAVSASVFPGYSYAGNYISDLGVPDVAAFQGRPIDSPLHAVMNTAFVLHGALFAAAALMTVRGGAWRPAVRRWFAGSALVHAIGIVLVGLFPGSPTNADNGLILLHVLGAAMAIIGGNTAVIIAGLRLRHARPRWLGTASITLGLVGLAGLAMLVIDSNSVAFDLLPDGVWERLSVYAILAWELLVGVAALATRRRRAGASS